MPKQMSDAEIQQNVRIWITQKMADGQTRARAFGDIIKNAKKNVTTLSQQIQDKRAALKGVDPKVIEEALEPFYITAHREERILVNANTVQDSEWAPA